MILEVDCNQVIIHNLLEGKLVLVAMLVLLVMQEVGTVQEVCTVLGVEPIQVLERAMQVVDITIVH